MGTPQHLAIELLMHMTGVRMTHVPYKGSSQSLSDLLAGHIPLVSAAINSAQPYIAAGKLRGLAVARSEEHTSELQSLMRHSYAVFCLKTKRTTQAIEREHKNT